MYILLLLIILLFISIIFKKYNILTIQNLFLLYLCIITTIILFCICTYDYSELFYLFNFEFLYSLLKLPVNEKVQNVMEVPVNGELKDLIVILTKSVNSLNANVELYNSNAELLLKEQKLANDLSRALLKQQLLIGNSHADKLAVVIENTSGLKSSITAVQNVCDLGFKNLNVSISAQSKDILVQLTNLNTNSKELSNSVAYLSNISVKTLESMYSLNNQFLVSSAELNKISSVVEAQNEITSNGFMALHKSLETSSVATSDLQNQIDLIKKKTQDDAYRNYVENQKLQKDFDAYRSKTDSELDSFKPKQTVIETNVVSSWFNSMFSNKPKA